MEQPKYDNKSSIPAVEVSTRPLEVDIAQSQKEANPLPPSNVDPDGNEAAKVDQDQDEKDGSVRNIVEPAVEPASPVVLPERK